MAVVVAFWIWLHNCGCPQVHDRNSISEKTKTADVLQTNLCLEKVQYLIQLHWIKIGPWFTAGNRILILVCLAARRREKLSVCSSFFFFLSKEIYIAPSGVHKERVMPEDLFVVDAETGEDLHLPPAHKNLRKSQCTPLFMAAYKRTVLLRSLFSLLPLLWTFEWCFSLLFQWGVQGLWSTRIPSLL